MHIACLDLEGVLIPEIWVGLAERHGIDALRATTRDTPDYDALMRMRLDTLAAHGLGIADVQAVIETLDPLPGAAKFLDWLRRRSQVAILSDTFYEFAAPFMRKLGWPMLLCHTLDIGDDGRIQGYRLRQTDPKRMAVRAFHDLRYQVVAAGDSYNDLAMLDEAEAGILFCAPAEVIRAHPRHAAASSYDEMSACFEAAWARLAHD